MIRCYASAGGKSKVEHSHGHTRSYTPRTIKQAKYIKLLEEKNPAIVVAFGAAGTGKTKLAVEVGLTKLMNGDISKLVLTRPTITVEDEQHGFLPGTLEQKMHPWLIPIYDAIEDNPHFSRKLDKLMRDGLIQVAPLAFMRGRTFSNAWIICDEAQNCTQNQLLMAMTRIGENSKMVIAGDVDQHDRKCASSCGLAHLVTLLDDCDPRNNEDIIQSVGFDDNDVQRSEVVARVLQLYGIY